jgi:maltooligosyltrehalose synthase
LLGDREDPPLGENVWADTAVELPKELIQALSLRNLLDGKTVPIVRAGNRLTVRLADALAHFPVALLAAASQTRS